MSGLSTSIRPHGGALVQRVVPADEFARRIAGRAAPSVTLAHDAAIHLANLASGVYSPLTGFMTETEFAGVVDDCRLPGRGDRWTIPVLLHVDAELGQALTKAESVSLRNGDGEIVGLVEVASLFEIDMAAYCRGVLATESTEHPGVRDIQRKSRLCVGGPVWVSPAALPRLRHYQTPAEHRALLSRSGKSSFTAFSTRNICHLGHEYLQGWALERSDILGIHVITGAQVKGSFLPDVVFDTYEVLMRNYYPESRVVLNNLRLPPIYAGPREAFLQAIALQNLGYTHFIVGRDHAGIGSFYERYASQRIFRELGGLDIEIWAISEPRYCKVCGRITTELSCRHGGEDIRRYNGRDVRRLLLEKRHNELEMLLRRELQEFLIAMSETRADMRRLFFD